MGQEVVSKGMSACSHGGVYSVNPNLVKVDCSSSINPLGTPKRAIAAVKKNVASLAPMYPDPECRELKKRLSHYLRVDPQWINVGNGAIEIIYWFAQAFAKNRVVIPAPTFCEYMIEKFENLVILRSLTKSFGLAGLRVGYSVCTPSLLDKLSINKIPWNVNGLAQTAGIAALADKKHLTKGRAIVKKERKFLYDNIRRLKSFSPIMSSANYFLVDLHGRNSTQFRDALLKKRGVLVRDCSTFTGMGTRYVRVAVKAHRENLQLLKALEAFDRG